MKIKECVVKNGFDWNLVLRDVEGGLVDMPHNYMGWSTRQLAFMWTLNWAKKLGHVAEFMKSA